MFSDNQFTGEFPSVPDSLFRLYDISSFLVEVFFREAANNGLTGALPDLSSVTNLRFL